MAYKELRIGSQPPTPDSVWSTILLQNPAISKSPQYQRIMTSLGLIIAAIWQHHWHSVIEGIPWSAQACLSTIRKRRPIATVTTRKKDELQEWMPAMTTLADDNMSEFGQPPTMKHLLYMPRKKVENYRCNNQRPTTFMFPPDELAESRPSLCGIAYL